MINHSSFKIVASLPDYLHMDNDKYRGAKALTSLDGKGVYVQYKNKFFEYTCTWGGNFVIFCSWTIMPQQVCNGVVGAVMMYLPPETTCF